jgi:hypothetical protein
LAVLCGVK